LRVETGEIALLSEVKGLWHSDGFGMAFVVV
jgi:hypothetical protein